ncbi:DUF2135 domain-containing protein [Rhodanobacter sp. L36]|uniref:YfaP family protein n=1 Tax=Rhodanobacter sp. L36 TaxID=1747221 RepID=UPI00131E3852|nr:DUF2135 domain-containing protein [Rhodanobacter sp. L36]
MTAGSLKFACVAFVLGASMGGPAWAQQAPTQPDEKIEFSAPINGWRSSAGDESRYTQEVHYPAVAVNTPEGQAASAMIAGEIRHAPKGTASAADQPATLIVNGVAMPQRVESDGHFSRPYAFGSGSNSVEMISADGTRQRTQFYEGYSGKTRPRLRVLLSWDSDGTDLDLHVVSPDGQHAFYGNRVVPNGGALDVDVTTGYGPEIYSNPSPPSGTYLVYVNYYGSGENHQLLTVAQVAIVTDEGTPNEKQQTFIVPMRKAGELTLVKSFVMP